MDCHSTSKNGNEVKTILLKKNVVPYNINDYDIYVTRKRPLIVYFKRAYKLLSASKYHNSIYKERLGIRRNKKMINNEDNDPFVVIHGMGACILTAIWLVQDLKSTFGDKLEIEINTKTIQVSEEQVIEDREWESTNVTRNISGISMKLTLKS